jgi:hypothetical protein
MLQSHPTATQQVVLTSQDHIPCIVICRSFVIPFPQSHVELQLVVVTQSQTPVPQLLPPGITLQSYARKLHEDRAKAVQTKPQGRWYRMDTLRTLYVHLTYTWGTHDVRTDSDPFLPTEKGGGYIIKEVELCQKSTKKFPYNGGGMISLSPFNPITEVFSCRETLLPLAIASDPHLAIAKHRPSCSWMAFTPTSGTSQ